MSESLSMLSLTAELEFLQLEHLQLIYRFVSGMVPKDFFSEFTSKKDVGKGNVKADRYLLRLH